MALFKCKMCGGALEINNNETIATCEYCGTQQTLPKLDDDRRANLYDRANHFRRNNEFDKAMGIYEQILNEDNADAEAYWSLVLCRYGIEYVEDPSSHKRVPTVNRAQFTSIFDDDNYKSAIEYADGYQRNIYEEEAKAINEIQKGILAISQKEEPKTTVVKETIVASSNANIEPLLKRAFMFLEDKDWNSANEYSEKVLDIEPECAEAYLGKLMAELRVCTKEGLKNCAEPFDGRNSYEKIMRFGDESLKNELSGYVKYINERNENARLDGIYTRAKNAMSAANTESAYKKAASLFESISEYQDSVALAQSCYEKAEAARKDAILSIGKAKMIGRPIPDYEAAIKLFKSISGWKDADERIYTCQKKIEEIKAKKEAERLERERIAKRIKRIAIITTTPIVCAIIAFIIVLNTVIIPNNKYNDAIALMDAGNLCEAYNIFIELGNYKDAADKADDILKNIKVGSYINFGAYEQDSNTSNGKEDIEWLVLEVKEDKVLVISKYAFDCQPYNTRHSHITWETCTLRRWLNNDFINSAFSGGEKAMITTVTVSPDENPEYDTNPGNATQDKVFLLSITEAEKYFASDSARQCKPTDYADANGVYIDSDYGTCCWWLRSPGDHQYDAAYVHSAGVVSEFGEGVLRPDGAVRPALWIDLNS